MALLTAHQSTEMQRRQGRKSTGAPGLSFSTVDEMGQFVKKELMEIPGKYVSSKAHLRKPADVTRKLVMANEKLIPYCRDSLKGGVGRILSHPEVAEAIKKHLDENSTLALYDSEIDEVVSVLVVCLFFYSHHCIH